MRSHLPTVKTRNAWRWFSLTPVDCEASDLPFRRCTLGSRKPQKGYSSRRRGSHQWVPEYAPVVPPAGGHDAYHRHFDRRRFPHVGANRTAGLAARPCVGRGGYRHTFHYLEQLQQGLRRGGPDHETAPIGPIDGEKPLELLVEHEICIRECPPRSPSWTRATSRSTPKTSS